jgi:hypothetical protein
LMKQSYILSLYHGNRATRILVPRILTNPWGYAMDGVISDRLSQQ